MFIVNYASTARALPQSAHIVGAVLAALPVFSLERVLARVSKENPDWSEDRLQQAECGYRRFLALAKSNRAGRYSPPTEDIDQVWHAHILITKQYHENCSDYFGYYLHHEPLEKSLPRDCHGGDCVTCVDIHAKSADCQGACEGTSCLGSDVTGHASN